MITDGTTVRAAVIGNESTPSGQSDLSTQRERERERESMPLPHRESTDNFALLTPDPGWGMFGEKSWENFLCLL